MDFIIGGLVREKIQRRIPEQETEDESWAWMKINEYSYRKDFHLTKKEFNEEPMEDIIINSTISSLFEKHIRKKTGK